MEAKKLDAGTVLWSVATGNVKLFRKASREAAKYIGSLDGFVAVQPCSPMGTLWFFESKNHAVRAKNIMESKGIKCGNKICSFTVGENGAPCFDEGQIP